MSVLSCEERRGTERGWCWVWERAEFLRGHAKVGQSWLGTVKDIWSLLLLFRIVVVVVGLDPCLGA